MEELTDATLTAETAEGLCLIEIGASWCAPCRALEPLLREAEWRYEGVRFFRLDADANPGSRERFDVLGLPTLILLRDGDPVATKAAAGIIRSQSQLDEFLRPHLQG